jgi:hypothetical protein
MTKKRIKELKDKLTDNQQLMYRCWKKNIIHEDSVVNMGGEELKTLIKLEGSKKNILGYGYGTQTKTH